MGSDAIRGKKVKNLIGVFVTFLAAYILMGIYFDFYLDLNDDVLISDIISGIYTGAPQAHCIQMLYPLSWLLSLLYKISTALPWYGIFCIACFLLCFTMIGYRLTEKQTAFSKKAGILFMQMIFLAGFYLSELVFIQYTVVSACLAATAAFWLYMTPEEKSVSGFLKYNIPTILLVVLAFNIRSEMLLLMAPFLACAGLLKWMQEKKFFTKENMKKYLLLILFVLAGMAASKLIDTAAYSTSAWREFRQFFEERTELYDFTGIPDYRQNQEFYEEIGISRSEYELLINYNFNLDEELNATAMQKITDYVKENPSLAPKKAEPLLSLAKNYVKRTFLISYPQQDSQIADAPQNLFILLGYLAHLALAFIKKDKTVFYKIPLLLFFRSISWVYILYRGRIVDRIIHPLYFIEAVLLLALLYDLLEHHNQEEQVKGALYPGAALLFLMAGVLLCATFVPQRIMQIKEDAAAREQENAMERAITTYTASHPQNYYYLDVYSTVTYSEKIFEPARLTKKNQELLGGWAGKSPLSAMKSQTVFDQQLSTEEAFLKAGDVYFLAEDTMQTDWLVQYYADQGKEVTVKQTDQIRTAGNESSQDAYAVYQIIEK